MPRRKPNTPAHPDLPDHLQVTVKVDTHTHDGKPCAKGDKLDVSRSTARWLAAQGVIEEEIK